MFQLYFSFGAFRFGDKRHQVGQGQQYQYTDNDQYNQHFGESKARQSFGRREIMHNILVVMTRNLPLRKLLYSK